MVIMTKKQYTSILFFGIGFLFLMMSTNMQLGTLANMGPGMYPFLVSCLLIGISIAYVFQSQKDNEPMNLNILDLGKMLGAMFLAIIAFKYLGILASILILVPLVSTLHKEWTWKSCVISTTIAAILAIILKFTVLKALPLW
jgi:hypothetical protein